MKKGKPEEERDENGKEEERGSGAVDGSATPASSCIGEAARPGHVEDDGPAVMRQRR
ncbi:hypothetical protein Syun_031432 [Stephania yunnanensis]|uniref:Uncharacterized protein n=1 Tax=Stephania yunnanensis TaxID=152371 RepID=A0AAP0DV60_9MAGN